MNDTDNLSNCTRDGGHVQQHRDPGDCVQSPLPQGYQDDGPGVQDLEDGGGDTEVLDLGHSQDQQRQLPGEDHCQQNQRLSRE